MSTNLVQQIEALHDLSVSQLRELYEELMGEECRSRHRKYLIRRIAWRMQANEEGGLSDLVLRRAEELAVDSDIRTTAPRDYILAHAQIASQAPGSFVDWDPRLPPPGNWIERVYKRRKLRVLVLAEGFEFEGKRFRSLTSVAKEITGSHCNGFLFFRLGNQATKTQPKR